MIEREKAKCVICLNNYWKATKSRDRLPKGLRSKNTKTCCKKCSRIYSNETERRKRGLYKQD